MLMLALALVSGAQTAEERTWTVIRDCADCPELVVIDGGDFEMGAEGGEEGRPEGPIRSVNVPPFAMARHEITFALFSAFVDETGHQTPGDCRSWDPERTTVDYRSGSSWRNPTTLREPKPAEPVVCVSWEDGKAFTAWLLRTTGHSYRLPTEAEWEYSAYAGATGDYYWKGGPDNGCADSNTYDVSGLMESNPWPHAECSDGFAEVAPVGSFRANPFGLYDMTGNVWEWAEDCYVAPYPDTVPTDGSAYQVGEQCEKRAVRGGSWITMPFRNRPVWRGRDPENFRSWIFGFRVARDLTANERQHLVSRKNGPRE